MNISEQCGHNVAIAIFHAYIGLGWLMDGPDCAHFVQLASKEAVYGAKYWTMVEPEKHKYDLTIVEASARSMAEKLLEVC